MVKNIIFDVGEVLFEYRWQEMLMEYGISSSEAEQVADEMFHDEIWSHGMDAGTMTQQEAIAGYRNKYPKDGDIIEWFITHGERMQVARPEVWDKLKKLKQLGYGIYILSNYSEDLFRKHTKDAPFMPYVDGKVVSYMIQKIKPDPAIYEYLLDTYKLLPEECIFFDDRKENVEGAKKMGMHSVQILSREMLNEELIKWIQKRENQVVVESSEESVINIPETQNMPCSI